MYPPNSTTTFDSEDFHGMTLKQAKQLWDNPRSRQVITLSSGKVGVCEVGDPKGFPVVWFTGNMGPAFTILLYENIAKRYRIRMFCVDRPGYNDTEDCYSKRGVPNIFEFVDMVNELTVFLGLYKFGLVTFSLGAVFGLAFSLRYPERLKGPVHLISPWLSTSTPGASSTMTRIARYAPNFLIRTTLTTVPAMNQVFGNLWGTVVSLGSFGGGGTNYSKTVVIEDDDGETITTNNSTAFAISPGRSYLYNQVYENGIWNLQNGKAGPHNDWMVALERVNWGYTYEETTYPVKVFIGDMDEEVPIAAWKYMSQRMKNVDFNVVEGARHYLLYRMDFMEDLFQMIHKSVNDDS